MAVKTKRTSMSLSSELLSNLDFCATNLGVTRSAFVSELLAAPLKNIREVLEYSLPSTPDGDSTPVRRTSAEVSYYLRKNLSGLSESLSSLETQLDDMDCKINDNSTH